MRASILLALTASTALVTDVREARACSPPEQGVSSREVLPEDGAIGVPRNARITISYDAYQVEPRGTLTLRAQGGDVIEVAIAEPLDRGFTQQLTPTAPLAPLTTYELLDTVTVPCWGDLEPCLGDAVVVATFTTGADLDTTPPRIDDVALALEFECGGDNECGPDPANVRHSLTVTGAQDDHGAAWVRYMYVDDQGNELFGPTDETYAIRRCDPEGDTSFWRVTQTFSLRAVDLAGNVEVVPHTFETASCDELDDGSPCDTDGTFGCNAGGGSAAAALAVLLLVTARLGGRRCRVRRAR